MNVAASGGAVDTATATMISLIGSLADNKSALGRRYGEWAVSAPTIESAVAAAAMAQDELGHARSTYPVLAKLGVSSDRRTRAWTRGHPLPVISSELPDWASVIAANLVVDGVLTTFVASARATARSSRWLSAPARSSRRRARTGCTRRRGLGGSWRPAARTCACSCGESTRCGRRRRVGLALTPTRVTARRSRPGWSIRVRLRSGAGYATGSARGSPGCRWTNPPTGRIGTRSTADSLPVLRLGRRRARGALGRPDHHEPDALPGVQHVLRGDSRRFRGRPAHG